MAAVLGAGKIFGTLKGKKKASYVKANMVINLTISPRKNANAFTAFFFFLIFPFFFDFFMVLK